jgi:hypothetical protein
MIYSMATSQTYSINDRTTNPNTLLNEVISKLEDYTVKTVSNDIHNFILITLINYAELILISLTHQVKYYMVKEIYLINIINTLIAKLFLI